MGSSMEWQALPVVVEILGVQDIEGLITELAAIRDFQNRSN